MLIEKKKKEKGLNKQKLSLIIICGKERKETQYLARIGHLMNLIRIHLEKFHLIRVQEERREYAEQREIGMPKGTKWNHSQRVKRRG